MDFFNVGIGPIRTGPPTVAESRSRVYTIGPFRTASGVPGFAATGVPPGTYYLRVRAINLFGISAPSAETQVSVGACQAPAAPSAAATHTDNLVTLSWTPVAGLQYRLEAGSAPATANLAVLSIGPTGSFTAAPPPGTYDLRLRAVSSCGVSAPSNEMVVTLSPDGAPAAPGGLTHRVLAGGVVELQWAAPAGAVSGYRLEAGSAPGEANLAVVTLGPRVAVSFNAVPAGTYFVRTRSLNSQGVSPPSNELVVTVP